jgi:hypothetical protein
MLRKTVLIATVAILLAAVGCGADQEQGQQEEDAAAPEETTQEAQTVVEETTVTEGTVAEGTVAEGTTPTTTSEVVRVGGFSVERPDGGETTVPQVTAEREDVQRYQAQIQPVIEETVRDVSDLVQADVRLENGNLSFDVEVATLEEARASVRDGLERLRAIDPPEDLEPIHQRLIETYEGVLPAYEELIEAAGSGDPQRMSAAVRENLPRIESFNEETRAIVQDLEQAAGS